LTPPATILAPASVALQWSAYQQNLDEGAELYQSPLELRSPGHCVGPERRPEGGVNGSLRKLNEKLTPIHSPETLSSNRQDNTSQLVTRLS